jgi:hypothetical protein
MLRTEWGFISIKEHENDTHASIQDSAIPSFCFFKNVVLVINIRKKSNALSGAIDLAAQGFPYIRTVLDALPDGSPVMRITGHNNQSRCRRMIPGSLNHSREKEERKEGERETVYL